jgi:hypothetical protein
MRTFTGTTLIRNYVHLRQSIALTIADAFARRLSELCRRMVLEDAANEMLLDAMTQSDSWVIPTYTRNVCCGRMVLVRSTDPELHHRHRNGSLAISR